MADLGPSSTAHAVTKRYAGLLDAFVVDTGDGEDAAAIRADGLSVLATDIMMRDPADAARLAGEVMRFAAGISPASRRQAT
jgi:2-phospho-L-lactate transferase/gluconeogenesis factor (CofD/UPF0052 family)